MQEISVSPYEQMVYVQLNISHGEWDTQTPLRFRHTNGSLNSGQTTRPYNNEQKKRTYKIVDFAVPADHRVKLKENEKKDKYLDLTRGKVVGHESDVYTNYNLFSWFSHQRINKGTRGLGYKWTNGDHLNYCEKRDEYLDLAREISKTIEHESYSDGSYDWCTWKKTLKNW